MFSGAECRSKEADAMPQHGVPRSSVQQAMMRRKCLFKTFRRASPP